MRQQTPHTRLVCAGTCIAAGGSAAAGAQQRRKRVLVWRQRAEGALVLPRRRYRTRALRGRAAAWGLATLNKPGVPAKVQPLWLASLSVPQRLSPTPANPVAGTGSSARSRRAAGTLRCVRTCSRLPALLTQRRRGG